MAEKVGEIYYDVTLETAAMLKKAREVEAQVGKTSTSFKDLHAKLTAVASAVGLVVIATKALQMAKVADEVRMLGARVQVAAGSLQAGAEAMRELEAISTRTRSSVAANADVFSRLNQSLLQMGGTQQDTLRLTELLGKGIAASGAKGQEAESAMRQFGQAMGTGKLSGDELNSMMENSQYLMQKLAQGMGVPVGALKKLGEDGKLTADVLLEAFGKMSSQIDEDFQKLPPTIESSSVVAKDAADRLSKALDDVSGTSAAMSGVLKGGGEALNALAEFITGVSEASTDLERNQAIDTWSKRASSVLSYVADGADFVTRGFRQLGVTIGGVTAAMGAALSGEFKQAGSIIKMLGNDLGAIGNAQYAGAAIRERLGKPTDPGSTAPFTKIRKPKQDDDKGKGGNGIAAAARRLALGEMRDTMREELAMLDAQQGQLDLRRSAGLMGETEYYAQKRALLVESNELEEKFLQDQISRLQKEKTNGKEALEMQQQIGALKSKLAVQHATAQNKVAALDQAAAAATAKHRAEVESLTQSHARYLAQIDQAASRRVAVAGMSSKGAQRAEGAWAIEDKYLNQERELQDRKLTSGKSWTAEDQSLFDMRIKQLQVEKQRELDVYAQTYAAIDVMDADWRVGAVRSVQEYADRAGDVAKQTQDAFTSAFQGMEDSLVSFAMTGKADFKSMAESIIADLIRIQIRASMVQALGGSAGGGGLFSSLISGATALLGGWQSAGVQSSGAVTSAVSGWGNVTGTALPPVSVHRANGGGVSAGSMVEVNERDNPELLNVGNQQFLMMAGQSGMVSPLDTGRINVASMPSPEGRGGGGAYRDLKVEITNKGEPVKAERAQMTRNDSGQDVLKIVIGQAVATVSDQIAGGHGPVHQAMLSRRRMGLS